MPCISDMQNVKQYLKEVGLTQKDFAERIGLSRPTLDAYIDMYESGQTIPKERYDIIFKKLFDVEDCSSERFNEKLLQVEGLLSRDKRFGTSDLEPEAADYVSLIVRNMHADFKEPDWSKDIYTFINILIKNYRDNEIFKHLAEYFVYLNGRRNVETIKESQKPYFANIYKTLRNLTDNPNRYDEEDYKAFLGRCEEIRESKKQRNNEQKERIRERVQKMISEYEEKGVDLSEEEIVEVLKEQLKKEKREQRKHIENN